MKHRTSLVGLGLALVAGPISCASDGNVSTGATEEPELREVVQPLAADVRHVDVYYGEGYFAAWPANHGIWSWGNEILFGFERGVYDPEPQGHHTKGNHEVFLARSSDGGEHWMIEKRPELDATFDPNAPPPAYKPPIDWSQPHFAMKLLHEDYWISEARGHLWHGPFPVPDFGQDNLSGRTALLKVSPAKTLVFISATNGPPTNYAFDNCLEDCTPVRDVDVARSIVFSTEDAGETFAGAQWIAARPGSHCSGTTTSSTTGCAGTTGTTSTSTSTTGCTSSPGSGTCPGEFNYSIMASPLMFNGSILVALRERNGTHSRIRIVSSTDNGATWTPHAEIPVDTNDGSGNGAPNNPGSLVKLDEQHVALVYGDRRDAHPKIWAKISSNGGQNWAPRIALTDGALNWDMGYVQAVTRPDGKVVVVYYFTTDNRPEQHIRATIWTPPGWVSKPGSSLSESLIVSAL